MTMPLSQPNVGGGVWRVKWHPSATRSHDLLVAAMHDGFKIVHFHDVGGGASSPTSEETWEVTTTFGKHASLAYGVDWSHSGVAGETVIGSASFYDHTLYTWKG